MKHEDIYLDRIPPQHKIRPKYIAWLSALLDKTQDFIGISDQTGRAFDLETAVGKQLDIIGQSVGISRLLNFEPKYADSARLNDEHYRIILRARISLNHWDGTVTGIYRLWEDVFSEYGLLVLDNQDMTMTLRVYGLGANFVSEYISRGYAAPKPEGVRINYLFILIYVQETRIEIGILGPRTLHYKHTTWGDKAYMLDTDLHMGVESIRKLHYPARPALHLDGRIPLHTGVGRIQRTAYIHLPASGNGSEGEGLAAGVLSDKHIRYETS